MNEKMITNKENGKNMLKIFFPIWCINAILFTICVFMEDYTQHIEHWSNASWVTMCVTLGLAKAALSVVTIIAGLKYTTGSEM